MSENENQENKSKTVKISDVVERLAKENVLFHDAEDNVGYIAVSGRGDKVIRIESSECKKWIRSWYIKTYKRYSIRDKYIDEICSYLSSIAEVDGEAKTLSVRLAKEVDGHGDITEILYDTCTDKAVSITKDGWSLIPTPIRFKHFPHQKPQALPAKTDSRDLRALREFVNIEDDSDWLICQVCAISNFVSDNPTILLCMNGDMGAGKSASLKTMVKLVDPSSMVDGMRMTWRTEDLLRYASHNSILFFDNLSKITDNQSDDLCKICTGGAFTKRRFYTDDEDVIYRVIRPVLISGIPRLIHRADLNDRSIILTVKRILEDKRKTQAELDAKFERLKPELLGAIFNILSDAIRKFKTTQPKISPRSADWYRLGCCIADSIDGYTQANFELAYKKVQERQIDYALQESPVALAAKFLVDKCGGVWKGTATQLLEFDVFESKKVLSTEDLSYMQCLQDHPEWPKNSSVLGKELARCRPTLEAIGIDMIHGENGKSIYQGNQRFIQLTDKNLVKKTKEPETLFDVMALKEKNNEKQF